jgi:hypothetical protein
MVQEVQEFGDKPDALCHLPLRRGPRRDTTQAPNAYQLQLLDLQALRCALGVLPGEGCQPMGKINSEWHRRNPMPRNASDRQRIDWHLEHFEHCRCRSIPAGVVALMHKHGIAVPKGRPTP